jgi:Holliday junction resolvasome RuvABC endonuclease subunit
MKPTDRTPTAPAGIILPLDLGSMLGWAIRSDNASIVHGTVEFRNSRFEGDGMRWLRFRSWLQAMHDGHGPLAAIYFEEVRRHQSVDAAHAYGGFLAHLTEWCERVQVPYQGIPVGTIKKHATGKGNAGKPAMVAAVRAKGFAPETHNDADAIALLLCVAGQDVKA